MNKEFTLGRLDVKAFAEEGGVIDGQLPLTHCQRLLAETEGRGAQQTISWSASGELRNPLHVQPQIWLHLRAHAVLALTCQRCLTPVDTSVDVDRSFRFVADEDLAASEDEQSEEDVLALDRGFNLMGLIEDELLLALPLAPRHEVCPNQLKTTAVDDDFESAARERENPFASLGKLKSGKT